MMNKPDTYTLEEIAEAFDLTPRTARHYIENVLPAHHKTGRGKLASYGRDTWNCFAFIQRVREDAKLSTAQLSDVLARLDQDQIDRVAEGREELAIYVAPGFESSRVGSSYRGLPSASMRARARSEVGDSEDMLSDNFSNESDIAGSYGAIEVDEVSAGFSPIEEPSWQSLISNDRLRVEFKGEISRGKREQVKLAAELIDKMLLDEG